MAQEQSTNSTASEKQKFPIKLVVILLIAAIAGYFGYQKISFSIHHESTDNAQVETQIIPVLPRVSGYVKTLNVKDYDSVKSGDLLVELDDAELQSQLAEQEADYNQSAIDIINAKATLQQALISLNVNKGTIDISNTKKQKALDDYNRDKNLFASEAITKKQLDESKFNYETAVKQWDNTINDLKSADSRIPVLNAAVQKAESGMAVKKAKIDQTKLKLTYTKIYAPVAGKIGKKSISIGSLCKQVLLYFLL